MGTDPAWGIAQNKLTFINGIKMKLSVIYGVLHMTIGIIHKGTNTIYFKDWPSFFTEVVAGTIILLGLFGWMDLLILGKWLTVLNIEDLRPADSTKYPHCAAKPAGLETNDPSEDLRSITQGDCDNQLSPSVINIMIDTVFNFGKSKSPEGSRAYIGADLPAQMTTGFALLVIVFLLIPVMLFVKPCCFRGDDGHDDDHENNQIEFANINNMEQNNQIQRSSDDNRGATDDAMIKR